MICALPLLFLAFGCTNSKVESAVPEKIPQTFEEFNTLWWQKNSVIECDAMLAAVRSEQNNSGTALAIHSHLDSANRGKSATVSSDIRFLLLERANCYMMATLEPQSVPELAYGRRRFENMRLLADIEMFRKLKRKKLQSQREEEEYATLLLVCGANSGIDMHAVAEKFDCSTLKTLHDAEVSLPDWLEWSARTPLIWTNVLMQLPQECAKVPNLNRAELSRQAACISRMIAVKMAKEHLRRLENKVKNESDERKRLKLEYEKRLADAWIMRFEPQEVFVNSRESDFLRDIYMLLQ